MFELIKDAGTTESREVTVSSITAAVGDMLELDAGATAWTVADATTEFWQKKIVLIESITSSDTLAVGTIVTADQVWKVEVANNSNADHNGDRMILTDQNTVNNTGSDETDNNVVFIQEAPVGTNTDKRAIGRFIAGTGVDNEAAD